MSDKPDYETTMDLPEATKAALATSAKQDDMIARLKKYRYVASDDLLKSDDTEILLTGTTPAKYYEVEFNPTGMLETFHKFRIKFDLKKYDAGTKKAYGRIYRNGAAIGTARETTSTSYTTYSEDIDYWELGDLIQLYCWIEDATQRGMVRNFRIYGVAQESAYAPTW